MTSTTPPTLRRTRSKSPRSRPTTPLRASSRNSLRDSARRAQGHGSEATPLDNLEVPFAELSDAMADLESNFMQLQLMHESLARFSESFAGFLYGLNMNAFCVDFPETPIPESFKRPQNNVSAAADPSPLTPGRHGHGRNSQGYEADIEATFLTTDTSFVDNPPSSKPPKFSTPAPPSAASKTGGAPARGRGGIPRAGARGGGIPVRGGGAGRGSRGGSGTGRGGATTTGRGRALR